MKKIIISTYAILCLFSLTAIGQIEIELRKSFIDSLVKSVTIDVDYNIARAHERPNTAKKDGDLHFAGTSSVIGLPVVAEIMNAKNEASALEVVHENEGTDNTVDLKGVWRIWCEHAGNESRQNQGGRFDPITSTNPDHVFEIHPVTKINSIDLNRSLKPISGFTYKKAEDAFTRYSNARCKIIPAGDMVIIETNGVGYNYVEFWIELLDEDQGEIEGGRYVFCRVLDKSGEIISHRMKMVFAKDSPPELKVKTKHPGDVMHVIGMPRINLYLVSYRIDHSDSDPDMLEWNLPVEMVIIGSFRR